jgi:hypothetical protein
MIEIIKKLFPICRSITGVGLKTSLLILKRYFIKNTNSNFKIYFVKSGTIAFDWKLPLEWVIKDAYLLFNNKKILDFKKNNLHVINYSYPINLKNVPLKNIKKYLFFDKKVKNAIPYITAYYKKKIGLCMTWKKYNKLKKGKYSLKIDSYFKKGFSYIGEVLKKGKSKKEVFFSTYLCHPSMANNELSGPAMSVSIHNWLVKNFTKSYFSYRFVIAPETIGPLIYLKKNFKYLKKNIIYAFNLTCQAGGKTFSYLPSKNGNTLTDEVAINLLKYHFKNFKTYSFLKRGSDERQYSSPGIDLPMISVMKKKYHEYPEYHTSLDNINFVKESHLQHTLNFYKKAIFLIENNYYCKSTVIGEPFLEKHFNVKKIGGQKIEGELKVVLDILAYSDGKKTLVEISNIINKSALIILPIIYQLKKKKLIKLSRDVK